MSSWVRKHGDVIGWTAVVGLIVAVDAASDQSMTASFRAASRHPVGRPVLILAVAYISGHLFGIIPADYDVLDRCLSKRP